MSTARPAAPRPVIGPRRALRALHTGTVCRSRSGLALLSAWPARRRARSKRGACSPLDRDLAPPLMGFSFPAFRWAIARRRACPGMVDRGSPLPLPPASADAHDWQPTRCLPGPVDRFPSPVQLAFNANRRGRGARGDQNNHRNGPLQGVSRMMVAPEQPASSLAPWCTRATAAVAAIGFTHCARSLDQSSGVSCPAGLDLPREVLRCHRRGSAPEGPDHSFDDASEGISSPSRRSQDGPWGGPKTRSTAT